MAKNTQLAYATCNAQADALGALLDGGYIDIYDGSQPANADTAVTTQTKLARLQFGDPAFGAAVNGVIEANAITGEDAALASGTATWCRLVKGDGSTVVMDGTVGTSNANLVLAATSIGAGAQVEASSFTHTVPRA